MEGLDLYGQTFLFSALGFFHPFYIEYLRIKGFFSIFNIQWSIVSDLHRISKIGLDDLGMVLNSLWRTLSYLLSKIKDHDPFRYTHDN